MSISVQEIPFNLAPGQELPVALNGRYIFIRQSSADIELRLSDSGTYFKVGEGEAYDLMEEGVEVEKFTVRNPNAGAVNGTIILSNAKVSRWIASAVKVKSGSETLGNANDVLVANAATLIAPGNADRSKVTVFAGSALLWIGGGDTLVAGTTGGLIPAEGNAVIETRGPIYGIRRDGDSATASYIEELL